MRLRNHDDDDAEETSVGRHRQDGYLSTDIDGCRSPAARAEHPDNTQLAMRPLVPASAATDAVVKATGSSFSQLNKSRSETHIGDVLANAGGQLATTDDASKCRLTLSKSTADWTALYEQS